MPSDETWRDEGRRLVVGLCVAARESSIAGAETDAEVEARAALLAHYEAGRCQGCGRMTHHRVHPGNLASCPKWDGGCGWAEAPDA